MLITSPRLHLPLRVISKEGKQVFQGVDILFGYLLFLEYGSFDFCIPVDCKLENGKVYVNKQKGLEEFKEVHETYLEPKQIKLLRAWGDTEDAWDPNFLLLCYVEYEESWEICSTKILNEYPHKVQLEFKRPLCTTEKNDTYEIPVYDTLYDAMQKAKQKKLLINDKPKTKPKLKQLKTPRPTKQPKINLKELEIKTTFTFLKGQTYEM
jgi:hypothetical protein